MALLLDTQKLIWLEDEPEKIKFGVKEKIFAEPAVFFSIVSVWEMGETLVANFIKDH